MNTNTEVKDPILSIVVPVYNVENYIKQCIQSLVLQTLNNIEIIVVNDETEDKSIEIVKQFNDSRIKIINKKNGGLSSARNAGIKVATGKYIAFVDSDDFIDFISAYEEIIDIAEEFNSDIVVGNACKYYESEKKIPMDTQKDIVKKIFEVNVISGEKYLIESVNNKRIFAPVWLNIYRTELILQNNLYFKEGILHEDELFSPQIFLKANKVTFYNKDFYNYRQREGSIMYSLQNKYKRVKDTFNICFELSKIVNTVSNSEAKIALSNYIAYLALSISYKYKIKLSKEEKNMIVNNSNRKDLKFKASLLNVNESLFYSYEFIIRKGYGLYRRLKTKSLK